MCFHYLFIPGSYHVRAKETEPGSYHGRAKETDPGSYHVRAEETDQRSYHVRAEESDHELNLNLDRQWVWIPIKSAGTETLTYYRELVDWAFNTDETKMEQAKMKTLFRLDEKNRSLFAKFVS